KLTGDERNRTVSRWMQFGVIRASGAVGGRDRVEAVDRGAGLELGGAVGLDAEVVAQALSRVLVDEDRLADDLGVRLEVGGQGDGVADARVGHAVLRAREARDDRP